MTDTARLNAMQQAIDRLFGREQADSIILRNLLSGDLTEAKFYALREQVLATMLASSAPDAAIEAAAAQFDFYEQAALAHSARNQPQYPQGGGA